MNTLISAILNCLSRTFINLCHSVGVDVIQFGTGSGDVDPSKCAWIVHILLLAAHRIEGGNRGWDIINSSLHNQAADLVTEAKQGINITLEQYNDPNLSDIAKAQIAALIEENRSLAAKNAGLEKQVRAKMAALRCKSDNIRDMTAKLVDAKSTLDRLESTNSMLMNDLHSTAIDLVTLRQTAEYTIEGLEAHISQLEAKYHELAESHAVLELILALQGRIGRN
jgi:hypothetical protein